VDVHTHFDAQVFWDGALTPSPLHGVTTALAGNCGFTIAPLPDAAEDRDYLLRMLARVEGMPLDALRSGVPWSWTTTDEYFAAIEGNLGINAGFMVGHSALRRTVLGADAVTREAAPAEVVAMCRLAHESLEAGALGISSSYSETHNDAEGNVVPSRQASREEFRALFRVAGEHAGTSLELIPPVAPRFEPWVMDFMADLSTAAQRPLNWNILLVAASSLDNCRQKLTAGDVARARGGKVVALTMPVSFGLRLSFRSGFILDAIPGWEQIMFAPIEEKLAVLSDREARRHLNQLAQDPSNPLFRAANWGAKVIFDVVAPENEQYRGRRVSEIAAQEGREPWDVLCDIAVADELYTSFGSVPAPEPEDDWTARLEVWRSGNAVIGASDAGAHLDMLSTFSFTTEMLRQAVRERGLLPFEEAVAMLTDVPARLYGLRQRGRVAEGYYADVVVLDPQTVASKEVTMRMDLPGRAGRLYAEADGIEHVLVNGSPIVRRGKLTDARPGVLFRSGRDTETPDLG
jgi:N-acyl-D-aspartate/D-glutamate deacylase